MRDRKIVEENQLKSAKLIEKNSISFNKKRTKKASLAAIERKLKEAQEQPKALLM